MAMCMKNQIFAFDLDGTIYKGDTLINGADDVVYSLRKLGAKVVFFTNASTRTVLQVHTKLSRMGLAPELKDIYTSARAAAFYASENNIKQAFCIGTDGLKEELYSNNIEILERAESAEAIIIGLDPDFSYAKLTEIMSCRNTACKLIACNRDKSYPIENNIYLPGCGPIVSSIEDALDRKVDYMVGKPNTYMLDLLSKQLGCHNSDITVIGDSYESDIQMANNYGSKSFFISSQDHLPTLGVTQVTTIREVLSFI